MTQANSHTVRSAISLSNLLNPVVLLLLGTPPRLGVRVVVSLKSVVAAAQIRINMGGAIHACA